MLKSWDAKNAKILIYEMYSKMRKRALNAQWKKILYNQIKLNRKNGPI